MNTSELLILMSLAVLRAVTGHGINLLDFRYHQYFNIRAVTAGKSQCICRVVD